MRWALGFTPKNDVQLPRKANILFLMELTVLLPTRRSIVCKVFWVGGEAGIWNGVFGLSHIQSFLEEESGDWILVLPRKTELLKTLTSMRIWRLLNHSVWRRQKFNKQTNHLRLVVFRGDKRQKSIFYFVQAPELCNYLKQKKKNYFTVESSIVVKYNYFIQCKIWQFYKKESN